MNGIEIIDKGANPLIRVSSERVLEWLRSIADEVGYADRASCAVQISVTQPFAEGQKVHHEVPELVFMVSNIKDSRT